MRNGRKRDASATPSRRTEDSQRGGVRYVARGVKKKLIAALSAVMAITLAVGMVFLPARETADAARSTAWKNIGEIYNDTNDAFDAENLNTLYEALTGKTGATFADVQTAVNGGNKTSADFRANNSENNISVSFGGFKWDAVYLTKATNGNIILDLWQSADNVTAKSKFNVWTLLPQYPHQLDSPPDLEANYPSNMYSTSKLRVEALNAGGYYSTDKNTLVGEEQEQNSENQYARFTMEGKDSNGKSSLIKYIATPSEVGYQANEFDSATAKAICNGDYYLPNEAYDGNSLSGGSWHNDLLDKSSGKGIYLSKGDETNGTNYGAWQNDYLWLPSITEAGCGKNSLGNNEISDGMWKTNDALRSTVDKNIDDSNIQSSWLRSGFFNCQYYPGQYENCYYFVYILGNSGNHADWTNDELDEYLVRPALHLNLSAANSSAERKTIGEIYNDGSKGFDADNLKELYQALTGKETFTGIKTAVGTNKTSANFRAQSGQNVSVWFGGMKWDAVCLITAKNGDVILDLWRSPDNLQSTDKSTYSNGWQSQSTDSTYPSNMYSTSKIRVETLNAGGYYSTDGSSLSAEQSQKSDNQYARFTMSSVPNSLTAYIAKPSEVAYQETENNNGHSAVNYTLPNDAYGDPGGVVNWSTNGGNFNYAGKGHDDDYDETNYEAWQNDYLWLPSLAETGNNDAGAKNGLWETNVSLRSTVIKDGTGFTWLRSGRAGTGAQYACSLLDTGGYNYKEVNNSYLVRPALHLNLTAINNTLKKEVEVPTVASKTYTGSNLTPDLTSNLYGFSWSGGTDVGTYDVTLTLTSPDDYMWEGKGPNESAITLTFDITKADNTWTSTVSLDGWTYGDAGGEPSAKATFGSVEYTYYSSSGGGLGTPLGDKPTDAGDYYVKATVPALASQKDTSQNNYDELVSEPLKFTISPQSVAVNWDPLTFIYNGAAQQPTPTATDKQKRSVLLNDVTVQEGEHINAGTYHASVTTSNANYTLTDATDKEFTIERATIDLPELGTATFNGSVQNAKALETLNGKNGEVLTLGTDYTVGYKGEGANTSPQNADTYTVTVTLKETEKAKNYNIEGTQTYTIEKAKATAEWRAESKGVITEDSEFTYDGASHTVTLTLKIDGTGYSAAVSLTGANSYQNADEYTFTATDESGNFTESTWTLTITVGKAKITVSGRFSSSTEYNGEEFKVDGATVKNALSFTCPTVSELSVSVSDISTTAADADEYKGTVHITFDETNFTLSGSASYTLTIDPKVLSAGDVQWTGDSFEYDGGAHAPTAQIGDVKGTLFDLEVNVEGGAVEANVEGGTYTATATLPGDKQNNYTLSGASTTFTVTPREIVVTLTFASTTYGDVPTGWVSVSASRPSGKAGNWYVGASGDISVLELTYSLQGEQGGDAFAVPSQTTLADVYEVTPSYRNTNYSVTFAYGAGGQKYTVLPRKLTATISLPAALTFGNIGTFGAELGGVDGKAGIVNGDELEAILSFRGTAYDGTVVSENAAPTRAGNYQVWVSRLSGEKAQNYEIAESGETSFDIQRKQITVEWSGSGVDFTYVYGQAVTPTAKAETGVGGQDTFYFTVEMTEPKDGDFVNVGTYTFAAKVKPEDETRAKNFEILGTEQVYHITTGTNGWTEELSLNGFSGGDEWKWTYDGETYTASAKATFGKVEITYSTKEGDPLGGAPKDVGIYLVTATVAADGENYAEITVTHQFEIEAKEISFTFSTPSKLVYAGIVGKYEAALNDVLPQDEVKPILTFRGNPNDGSSFPESAEMPTLAGEYSVTLTLGGAQAGNYKLQAALPAVIEFTIQRKQIAVEWSGSGVHFTYVYGEAVAPTAWAETDVEGQDIFYFTVEMTEPKDGDFVNVGTYTFAAKVKPEDETRAENFEILGTEQVYHITTGTNRWTEELSLNGFSGGAEWKWTYDGETYTASAKATFGKVEITYSTKEGDPLGGAPKDVGIYLVTATVAADGENYAEITVTHQFEIEAKEISFTFSTPSKLVYAGIVGKYEAALNDVLPQDEVKPILTFRGTPNDGSAFPESTEMPTLAGEYSVTLTLGGAQAGNYKLQATLPAVIEFTIAKATVEKPTADTRTFFYTGLPQEYSVQGGDAELFGVKDGSNVQTNANEEGYLVVIALNDKHNYMWETDENTEDLTFIFVIRKATLTVTAKDKTITYGDAPSNEGVEYSGLQNGERVEEVVRGTVQFGYDGYRAFDDVGAYNITPSGLEADNYDFEYVAGTLTVGQKEISVSWGNETYTYTGSAFTELPTATAEGIGTDGTFTLLVALSDATQTFLNAGEYFFHAELDSADAKAGNYVLEETSAIRSYLISKKPVAAPSIQSKVYNGANQTADVLTEGMEYGVKTNLGGTNVGDYDVVLALNDAANFMWEDSETSDDKTLLFRITKATYDMEDVKAAFTDVTVVYDAEEHGIYLDETLLPQGVTVTYDGNGEKKVGKYTVTASFAGDAENYFPIEDITALLTIVQVSHDLSEIRFENVTVKFDGEAHSIYIEGTLPVNVTVTYQGNGKIDPNIYTVTAVFGDPDGTFEERTATLVILRTYTQNLPEAESDAGGSGDAVAPDAFIDSEEGFDPTLELVVEKIEGIARKYWAWEKDEISEEYAVKLCRDGVEVPIDGKMTVRLLIPEAFREKDFELKAVARSTSVEFTRDGDYVVFETDGLSTYVFTSMYTSYFPVILLATGVLLIDVVALIALAVVVKKKLHR